MGVFRKYTRMYKPQQLSIPFDRAFLVMLKGEGEREEGEEEEEEEEKGRGGMRRWSKR